MATSQPAESVLRSRQESPNIFCNLVSRTKFKSVFVGLEVGVIHEVGSAARLLLCMLQGSLFC